jgi:hypothetical protein
MISSECAAALEDHETCQETMANSTSGVPSLRDLAEDLFSFSDPLTSHLSSNPATKQWSMVWMLSIGALRSLHRAEKWRSQSRNFEDQFAAAKEVLNQFISGNDPATNVGPWLIGYYLLSAEQRIALSLHRLLQAYASYEEYAFPIIKCLASSSGNVANTDAETVLFAFGRKELKDSFGTPPKLDENTLQFKQGNALRQVWKRVNDIKHNPEEQTNKERAEKRFMDAVWGMAGLNTVFRELAKKRGIL